MLQIVLDTWKNLIDDVAETLANHYINESLKKGASSLPPSLSLPPFRLPSLPSFPPSFPPSLPPLCTTVFSSLVSRGREGKREGGREGRKEGRREGEREGRREKSREEGREEEREGVKRRDYVARFEWKKFVRPPWKPSFK